jgi:hypothetical protein
MLFHCLKPWPPWCLRYLAFVSPNFRCCGYVCTAGHPSALVPWRSCRVLVSGRLQWVAPAAAVCGPPAAAAVGRAARRGVMLPGPVYVSTAQVGWMFVLATYFRRCCCVGVAVRQQAWLHTTFCRSTPGRHWHDVLGHGVDVVACPCAAATAADRLSAG